MEKQKREQDGKILCMHASHQPQSGRPTSLLRNPLEQEPRVEDDIVSRRLGSRGSGSFGNGCNYAILIILEWILAAKDIEIDET